MIILYRHFHGKLFSDTVFSYSVSDFLCTDDRKVHIDDFHCAIPPSQKKQRKRRTKRRGNRKRITRQNKSQSENKHETKCISPNEKTLNQRKPVHLYMQSVEKLLFSFCHSLSYCDCLVASSVNKLLRL